MNEIEKQILLNQKAIMEFLIFQSDDFNIALINQNRKNNKFLNPPEQQSIAEKTHDAFSQSSEVKKL